MTSLSCRVAAITRRKIELRDEDMVRAINAFDLSTLATERVEILQRVLPNDKEVKAFKEYDAQHKPVDALSDEDKFLYSVSTGFGNLPLHFSLVNVQFLNEAVLFKSLIAAIAHCLCYSSTAWSAHQ